MLEAVLDHGRLDSTIKSLNCYWVKRFYSNHMTTLRSYLAKLKKDFPKFEKDIKTYIEELIKEKGVEGLHEAKDMAERFIKLGKFRDDFKDLCF